MENNSKRTVLIVDDDAVLRKMYTTKLEASGFAVTQAENGLKGSELFESQKFDVILVDIMMPQMTGLEMLEKLRESPNIKDTLIFVFSNLTEKEQQEKATSLGIKEFLIKADLTPSALVSKITSYLK